MCNTLRKMSIRIQLFILLGLLHLSLSKKVKRDPLRSYAKVLAKTNPLAKSLGVAHLVRIQRKLVKKGSCSSRICFAIDGSSSISRPQFMVQKDFVKLIASLAALDDEARFSAVQFGLSNVEISKQTKDIRLFLISLTGTRQTRTRKTFLAAGLGYCVSTLKSARGKQGRKIVVLGDGKSNFANGAVNSVVKKISKEVVIAVHVGLPMDRETLKQIATKTSGEIFGVKRYGGLKNVVEGTLFAVCK